MNNTELIDTLCCNTCNSLVLGFAGSGKSTMVKRLSLKIGERCLKLAPTGQTASNIDGFTLDSLLECYKIAKTSTLEKLKNMYDYIIIDEISMVHDYKLSLIYQILTRLSKHGKLIKLIMVGDIFQLLPVVTKDMIKAFSLYHKKALIPEDFIFFNSEEFKKDFNNHLQLYLLTSNYRQKETYFGKILKKIAIGIANKQDIEYINQRVVSFNKDTFYQNCPVIIPHRFTVKLFNKLRLFKFPSIICNYPIFDKIKNGYKEVDAYYRDITEPIYFALDTPIIFNQNDTNGHWVNGTKGIISNYYEDYLNKKVVEIKTERGEIVKCSPTKHFLRRFIYDSITKTVKTENVAVIIQLPFNLGFALTVHKSQGMTLNTMTFNIGNGLFASGQLYVALSRVRKIDNLSLHIPIRLRDIIVSSVIREFYEIFLKKCEIIIEKIQKITISKLEIAN
jgi:ATP-dependent exoDNAse (exonuclease V) alpha subunit